MDLTLKQARRLMLHSQGLLQTDSFGRGINAVSRAIRQLHYVQIDTISVVDRAHQQVLKTRVGGYQAPFLDQLMDKRDIFEYWAHAAALLPIEDYRFYRPIMEGYASSRTYDKKMQRLVLQRISQEGPLQSRDFEHPRGKKSNGWWDWKPAKQAMEHLFLSGKIMVDKRLGFQKAYDLTARVLPSHISTAPPSNSELGGFYVKRMLNALGLAQANEIGYARSIASRWAGIKIQPLIDQTLAAWLANGEIESMQFGDKTYFALSSALATLPARIAKKRLVILSPFDNLVINRRRLLTLFAFDYQLECYVPKPKRQFGYFTLPILWGDEFIGRMDCKAHRKEAKLVINNLWLEANTTINEPLIHALAKGLKVYLQALNCTELMIQTSEPKWLKRRLQDFLQHLNF